MQDKVLNLHILQASPEHAALVRRIMLEAFAEYLDVLNPPSGAHQESVEDVARAISTGGAILALDQDAPVGSARFRPEPDHLYVGRVAVLPQHRGRGIGAAMMQWMEEKAVELGRERVQVGVRMSLPSNLAFFERLGYQIICVQDHPRGPDRFATMVKSVRPSERQD